MESNNSENRIRIIFTSDVHGKVYPHSYADGSSMNVGFARISTFIDELRDENTILIDNGDVLEGSALQLYHMMEEVQSVGKAAGKDEVPPSPVSVAINQIGYDYINIGNHDFNFGVDILKQHIEDSGAICITSNIIDDVTGKPIGSEFAANESKVNNSEVNYLEANYSEDRDYVVTEIHGKKIAIFGLITQYVPHWESHEHLSGVSFLDAFDSAVKTVATIKERENPDYIICAYHGGFERDPDTGEPVGIDNGENQGYRILERIPDIDIFLTGHQHRIYLGSYKSEKGNTYYVQPGCNGENIAVIDIYPDTGEISPAIMEVDSEPDKGIMNLLEDEEAKCQNWLDQTIGKSNIDLRVYDGLNARLNKAQIITYINKVQMEFVEREFGPVDISSVALFYGSKGIGPDITMRQLVSTYVFPDNLVVKRITGRILKEYLEKDMEFWSVKEDDVDGTGTGKVATIDVNPEYLIPYPQHFNYDMLDGIEYDVAVTNPVGSRVTKITKNGEPIKDNDEFKIVISNYRAAGGGGFNMLSDAETLWENSKTMVEILAEDIKKKKIIDFEPVNNINIGL